MHRLGYTVAVAALSWLLMQAVHELGHVLGAWATGARVERVVLHPLTISRTDVGEGHNPLIVVWAGPLIGALLPLVGTVFAGRCRPPYGHAVRFFAGFCLIANGAYLGIGSFEAIGDAGELLRLGSPRLALWLFAAVTIPAGLAIWHRLGHRLGFASVAVSRRDVVQLWLALLSLIALEVVLSPR